VNDETEEENICGCNGKYFLKNSWKHETRKFHNFHHKKVQNMKLLPSNHVDNKLSNYFSSKIITSKSILHGNIIH
jgi:hypothetical protein